MDRITIIGFGPYGASIGLRLKKAKLLNTEIVGTSRQRSLLSAASKIGAVDKVVSNVVSAIANANLIILDTPLSDTKELLEMIGERAKQGCVITDTGSSKVMVMDWANTLFPKGINYVGGHPLLKRPVFDIKEADPGLFEDIEYCLTPAESADPNALKTVVHLVETLGAKPVFMDAHEHDSYSVAMACLPTIVSSAYVNATSSSVSWREMNRLAANEFSQISLLSSTDPQDTEAICLANPDDILYWIDQLIAELYDYRTRIIDQDKNLLDVFVKAWESHARWEAGAVIEDDGVRLPSTGESIAATFFGERLLQRYQDVTSAASKKKNPWTYYKRSK